MLSHAVWASVPSVCAQKDRDREYRQTLCVTVSVCVAGGGGQHSLYRQEQQRLPQVLSSVRVFHAVSRERLGRLVRLWVVSCGSQCAEPLPPPSLPSAAVLH